MSKFSIFILFLTLFHWQATDFSATWPPCFYRFFNFLIFWFFFLPITQLFRFFFTSLLERLEVFHWLTCQFFFIIFCWNFRSFSSMQHLQLYLCYSYIYPLGLKLMSLRASNCNNVMSWSGHLTWHISEQFYTAINSAYLQMSSLSDTWSMLNFKLTINIKLIPNTTLSIF